MPQPPNSYHTRRLFAVAPALSAAVALLLAQAVAFAPRTVAAAELLMMGRGADAAGGREATLTVEVADTPSARVRGLSGRAALPANRGLLFDFKRDGRHGIWMKDMRFAIDIIWLDHDARVVDVKRGARPETFPEVYRPKRAARYVLELSLIHI